MGDLEGPSRRALETAVLCSDGRRIVEAVAAATAYSFSSAVDTTVATTRFLARQPEITGNDVGEPFQTRWQLDVFFRGIERHNEHICLH